MGSVGGWELDTLGAFAQYLQPEVIAFVAALVLLWLDARRASGRTVGISAVVAALAVFASAVFVSPTYPFGFTGLAVDRVAVFGRALVSGLLVLVSFFVTGYARGRERAGLFFGLVWLSAFGAFVLAESADFVTLLIALEVLSLPAYALAAFRGTRSAVEGSLKYFLYGAVSSALYVFGVVLVVGVTGGAFDFYSVAVAASALAGWRLGAFALGFVLVVGAFGYKVAFFPWQLWAPDAYQGMDGAALTFLGIVPKVAGFLALYRFVLQGAMPEGVLSILMVMGIMSLVVANFSALVQNSLQRIVAYSSISHAGFMVLAFLLSGRAAESVLTLYLFAYGLSNLAFIASLLGLERGGADGDSRLPGIALASLNGLYERAPSAALLLALGALSLAGVPPLPGFFAKLYLFKELADAGLAWVVAVGVVMSAVSLGYYLRLVRRAYFYDPASAPEPSGYIQPLAAHVTAVLTSALLLGFVFYASLVAA